MYIVKVTCDSPNNVSGLQVGNVRPIYAMSVVLAERPSSVLGAVYMQHQLANEGTALSQLANEGAGPVNLTCLYLAPISQWVTNIGSNYPMRELECNFELNLSVCGTN